MALAIGRSGRILACWPPCRQPIHQGGRDGSCERVKDHAASPTSFDAAVQEGLARASKTLRGITGLHVIEEKASVKNGKIDEYRVTMEVTSF